MQRRHRTTLAGQKLRRWREANELTLAGAAERLGLKQGGSVLKYETGARFPEPAFVTAMQDVAGIDPGDWYLPAEADDRSRQDEAAA